MRPDVVAVVHTHAPSLIPFGVTKVPLKPMYHRSAFISFGIPVFEIRDRAGMTDMLIRNPTLGHDLAEVVGNHPAALMRGHGVVITGPSLPRVVGRTIFLALNATLQMQAMSMGAPITYMDDEEARKNRGAREPWACAHLGRLEAQGDTKTVIGAPRTWWEMEAAMASNLDLTANFATPTCRPIPYARVFAPMNARSAPTVLSTNCIMSARIAVVVLCRALYGRRPNGGQDCLSPSARRQQSASTCPTTSTISRSIHPASGIFHRKSAKDFTISRAAFAAARRRGE